MHTRGGIGWLLACALLLAFLVGPASLLRSHMPVVQTGGTLVTAHGHDGNHDGDHLADKAAGHAHKHNPADHSHEAPSLPPFLKLPGNPALAAVQPLAEAAIVGDWPDRLDRPPRPAIQA